MRSRRWSVGVLVAAVCCPAPAAAQEPEPYAFTPPGYVFCGWRDHVNGGWAMEWNEDLYGAYTVLFARRMSCRAARRNHARTRFSRKPPYRALRTGYRCKLLESRYEYSDTRCTKRSRPRLAYRWQTGA